MTKETPERSVENTGSRPKVFVSYSRKDLGFAQMLVEELGERGYDAFLDKTDIAPGEPWKERLGGLIAAADTVVFAISPESVASSVCAWELEESARLGKRLIPVVARRIADADAPPALGRLNWVFLSEGDDKEAALAALDEALHTDLAWVREHTRLGELARRWDEQKRSKGATLRGADLEAAERWLDHRPADANAPTDLHQDFIRASRHAATGRQRMWVGGSLTIAVLAIGLAIFAEVNRREAQTQRDRAEHTLALATKTANSLVFDLAQKFRDVVGVPAATVKDILDRSRELQEQLLSSGETSYDLRRSQAVALIEMGATLESLGDSKGAEEAGDKARDIFEALLRERPESTDYQRQLAIAYDHTGDALESQGKLPDALRAYQSGLAVMDRLPASDPDNAYEVTNFQDRIGNVLVAQGDLGAALKSYQASLALREQFAKSQPANMTWQNALSVSHFKIGQIQEAQGDLDGALKSYQTDLAIAETVAKSDPSNGDWQRELSVDHVAIGDLLRAQGHLEEALQSFRDALAIRERLAKSESEQRAVAAGSRYGT